MTSVEYWNEQSDLVVKKSSFDDAVYIVMHNRNGVEKYLSSHQLAIKLNNEKVVILNKKGKTILHKNFVTMKEAIG